MTTALIFGAICGIGLGMARFKIFALLAAIPMVLAGVLVSGLASGMDLGVIGLAAVAAAASVQIAYLVSFLATGFIFAQYLRVRAQSEATP